MFTQKRYIMRIDAHSVTAGYVVMGDTPGMESKETLAYTRETLGEVLGMLRARGFVHTRVVISDGLVYTTEFTCEQNTLVTRETVGQMAAERIPEDIQNTEWDFQTLHFVEQEAGEGATCVQVAVMESGFAQCFREAVRKSQLDIACVLPESYVLARCAASQAGISLIVQQHLDEYTLVATESGHVIAASSRAGEITKADIVAFCDFVRTYRQKPVVNIIGSCCAPKVQELLGSFVTTEMTVLSEAYDPLMQLALEKKVTGRDADVLNMNTWLQDVYLPVWRRLFVWKAR